MVLHFIIQHAIVWPLYCIQLKQKINLINSSEATKLIKSRIPKHTSKLKTKVTIVIHNPKRGNERNEKNIFTTDIQDNK